MRVRTLTHSLALAIAGAVLAATVLAFSVWRAMVVRPLPAVADESANVAAERDLRPRSGLSEAALVLAADADPFRPDRTRAANDPAPVADAATDADRIASIVQLIGTVVLPDEQGLAMLRIGEESARVVRVGHEVGSFRLVRVAPGTATLETADGTAVTVRVDRGTT
jgi:hypothetical protein